MNFCQSDQKSRISSPKKANEGWALEKMAAPDWLAEPKKFPLRNQRFFDKDSELDYVLIVFMLSYGVLCTVDPH